MTLLGNLAEELLSGFRMEITTPMLSQEFRKKLVGVIKNHKGNIPLSLHLYDPETQYRIPFYSKKYRVAVSTEFTRELQLIGVTRFEVERK